MNKNEVFSSFSCYINILREITTRWQQNKIVNFMRAKLLHSLFYVCYKHFKRKLKSVENNLPHI